MKLLVIALLILASSGLFAQDQPISSRMEVFLITTTEDGTENAVAAAEALPGDTLEYRLSYLNTSQTPLRALVVTGPVPGNTDFIGDTMSTAVASDVLVSVDGGNVYESEPVKRTRSRSDGTQEEYVVPPSRYTHVRWRSQEALQPARTQEFSYRVIVE